ncbi:MAG: GH116 family glycosyl-hydrolase, partial [Cyclobacteriaceae bacterium]
MKKHFLILTILASACISRHDTIPEPNHDSAITYSGDSLKNISIPLGGIGTGDILIGGRGNIKALEIFNRAAQTGSLPYMTFFSLWFKEGKNDAASMILESRLPDDSPGPYGIERRQLSGLPRFEKSEFTCRYPFVNIQLMDENVPLKIQAEYFNPLIPLDVDNSSLPLVQFNWTITNTGSDNIQLSLAMNLANPLLNKDSNNRVSHEGNTNRYYQNESIRGISFLNKENLSSPLFGNLLMSTTFEKASIQTAWYEGAWWDDATIFWDDFSDDGRIKERHEEVSWEGSDWYGSDGQSIVGNITAHVSLQPGESVKIPFYLSWYVPNRILESSQAFGNDEVVNRHVKNYYATQFESSADVLDYYLDNEKSLYDHTRKYVDVLYGSSMPPDAIDAVSANTAILKSTLLMRTGEGWVHGFEGMGQTSGCCPGNCTHVWNYAQTMASLFPQLEQKVREVSFMHDTHDNGYQCFRTVFPLSDNWFRSVAADGQMGNIIRVYREWKNTGDTDWLKMLWPKVKLSLEFAWKGSGEVSGKYKWQEHAKIPWDPYKEGVMRGRQHNTYDIDFFGPNMMTGSLYLAALKACSEMALHMGEEDKHKEYLTLYQSGREKYELLLWNGSYFVQNVEVIDGIEIPDRLKSPPDSEGKIIPKYQFADGCLTDQLLGQFLAFNAGLGYVVDETMVKKAMHSVFKYNFIPDFSDVQNVQRVFAVNNEGGMVIGTWPNGNRPRIPFVYADEVWTGVEYEAAANMIWTGLVDEGLEVVKTLRNRYRGFNR